MKIENFHVAHLRNDAHFQFQTEFRDLVVKHGAQTLKVKQLFDTYLPLWEREDEALKKISKSALTAKINETDAARDETFSGMIEINKGMCKHFDPVLREAAAQLQILFDTYGNVAKKPLNEQTGALYNLLQDLRSDKYRNSADSVGISAWARELETRNEAFEKLMKERFDETAAKCDIVLKTARAELDVVYRKIVERINALVIVDGEADYETFVKTLNAVIAKYAVRKHARHAVRETADAPGA